MGAEILFDDTYTGPRYRYGLTLRPLGAGTPKGFIVWSLRGSSAPAYPFGTVDYPHELDDDTVDQLSLIPLGPVV